ncbi:DedA family protein [Candidatus Saccharibacteria bacterium]|nr:DedA family protein [Candidatus Saccharibacteria bacterium]
MRKAYFWVVGWAEKPQAEKALAGLSFAESSFFPIPPDPLLIAIVTAQPKKWLRFATITTLASVAGGMLGYIIGAVAINAVMPTIIQVGYEDAYKAAVEWFANYGALAVIVAGFTPIPYKIFTIAGGAAGMFLPLFLIGSIIGRGGRFYLVAFLMQHFGKKYKDKIEKYIDVLGFAFIVLLVLGFIVIKYVL